MRKDTLATRSLLINTAEQLFVEQGLENTTLFDVFKASGLKNRSALQYHFKDKVGLINAVLNKNAERVAEQRKGLLEQLGKQQDYSLYQVIEAIVRPMADQLENNDGGSAFIDLHSQLMVSRQFRELRLSRIELKAEELQLMTLIQPFLPESMTQAQLEARRVLIDCQLIHGLAGFLNGAESIDKAIFVDTLIQSIIDLLQQ